jgi:hypothetical protein
MGYIFIDKDIKTMKSENSIKDNSILFIYIKANHESTSFRLETSISND